MSAEEKITLIALRNILVNGDHVAALTEFKVEPRTAQQLLARRVAAVLKPRGLARAKVETAVAAPLVAEVATSARASPRRGAVIAPPKSPRRKAAQ